MQPTSPVLTDNTLPVLLGNAVDFLLAQVIHPNTPGAAANAQQHLTQIKAAKAAEVAAYNEFNAPPAPPPATPPAVPPVVPPAAS